MGFQYHSHFLGEEAEIQRSKWPIQSNKIQIFLLQILFYFCVLFFFFFLLHGYIAATQLLLVPQKFYNFSSIKDEWNSESIILFL